MAIIIASCGIEGLVVQGDRPMEEIAETIVISPGEVKRLIGNGEIAGRQQTGSVLISTVITMNIIEEMAYYGLPVETVVIPPGTIKDLGVDWLSWPEYPGITIPNASIAIIFLVVDGRYDLVAGKSILWST